MTEVLTRDGDMLDALVRRHLGDEALTPQALTLNPGLAAMGPVYRAGIRVRLPAPAATLRRGDVRLWGRT